MSVGMFQSEGIRITEERGYLQMKFRREIHEITVLGCWLMQCMDIAILDMVDVFHLDWIF
jgi:hypothetical protein